MILLITFFAHFFSPPPLRGAKKNGGGAKKNGGCKKEVGQIKFCCAIDLIFIALF